MSRDKAWMNRSTPFVILGTQRTGTILLMGLLDSHPDIVCLGELLQRKADRVQHSVPRYRLFVRERPVYQLLDFAARKLLVGRYLDTVSSSFTSAAVGFKLMLNQAHRYPMVLDYIKQKNYKLVHIERKNLLKTYISRLKAQQTGLYVSERPVDHVQVTVPVELLKAELSALSEENAALRALVIGLGLEHISMTYRQISGQDQQSAMQKVLAFLGVSDTATLATRSVKLTPDDLRQAVSNYDTMAAELAGSAYETFLTPAVPVVGG